MLNGTSGCKQGAAERFSSLPLEAGAVGTHGQELGLRKGGFESSKVIITSSVPPFS